MGWGCEIPPILSVKGLSRLLAHTLGGAHGRRTSVYFKVVARMMRSGGKAREESMRGKKKEFEREERKRGRWDVLIE